MASSYSTCPKCLRVNKIDLEKAEQKAPTCGACHAPLDFHDGITNLSDQQVRNLIEKSPLPVVVDFWAPWCGPCRAFAPAFASAAADLKGRFVFVKVNTEEHPAAGQLYGVRGIPTLAVFKNGREVDRQAGAMPKEHFVEWLQSSER